MGRFACRSCQAAVDHVRVSASTLHVASRVRDQLRSAAGTRDAMRSTCAASTILGRRIVRQRYVVVVRRVLLVRGRVEGSVMNESVKVGQGQEQRNGSRSSIWTAALLNQFRLSGEGAIVDTPSGC